MKRRRCLVNRPSPRSSVASRQKRRKKVKWNPGSASHEVDRGTGERGEEIFRDQAQRRLRRVSGTGPATWNGSGPAKLSGRSPGDSLGGSAGAVALAAHLYEQKRNKRPRSGAVLQVRAARRVGCL